MSRTASVPPWLVLGALGAAAALQPPLGCQRDPAPPASPQEQALLEAVGPEVVVPALSRFRDAAGALRDAVAAWDAAAAAGDDGAAREAVAEPFRAALLAWEEVEQHQIGPAAPARASAAGQDLRDEVYSWPTVNPCRVDQETAAEGYAAADFTTSQLVNVYGLDALEHLVFAGPDPACPADVPPASDGAWDALGPAGVDQRRAAYALVVTDAVISVADGLLAAWDPGGGDFGRVLAHPDGPDSPFTSANEAVTDVFEALFYVELVLRERKLSEPLGLGDCTAVCASEIEAVPSGVSTRAVAANLRGFRALFTGGEGAGFDDLLVSLDRGDLAEAELAAVDDAIAAAEALDAPLDVLVATDPDAALALHDAVKVVTGLLEGDIATVLSLDLPAEVAGDLD
ncbi:MAG: imelysin family protein [Myxococcota bacterium]